MKKTFLLISTMCSAFSFGIEINNQDSYFVKDGDTLWDISEHFLKNPWEWKSIWKINPQIKNPHLIYPNDKISLIYRNGVPELVIEKSTVRKTLNLNKKVSIISSVVSDSLPSINSKRIEDFENNMYISESELTDKVIASYTDSLLHYKGDKVYLHLDKTYEVGDIVSSYKLEDKIKELGFVYQKTGDLKIINKNKKTYTAQIITNNIELSLKDFIGDIEKFNSNKLIYPTKPENILDLNISYIPKRTKAVLNDVVILSKGSTDGVKIGNIFTVMNEDKKINVDNKKIVIKGEEKGLVLVYKVENNFSYAIIVKNDMIVVENDSVKSPF